MGILDAIVNNWGQWSDDPRKNQANDAYINALAAGLLSGRSNNFGVNLGRAMGGAQGALGEERDRIAKQGLIDAQVGHIGDQKKLIDAQVGYQGAQGDRVRFEIEQAKAAQDRAGKIAREIAAFRRGQSPSQGSMSAASGSADGAPLQIQPLGASTANPAQLAPQSQTLPAGAGSARRKQAEDLLRIADIYEQNGHVETAVKQREAAAKLFPEVATRETTTTPAGKITYRQYYKDGSFEDLENTAPRDPNKAFNVVGGSITANKPLQAYEIGKAGAGATRVLNQIQAYAPASEVAQQDFMRGLRSRYDQLQAAPTVLDNIDKAKAIVSRSNPFIGSFGEKKMALAQFLNNNVGTNIDPESIKDASELKTRLFMQIAENLKKMDASPSQMQQVMMMESFGNLTNDPKALPAMLDVYGDIVREKVSIHNRETAGAIKRGVLFPYDPVIELRQPNTPATNRDGWSAKRVN